MKKLIDEKYLVVCPVCGKNAIVVRQFDNFTAECIHMTDGGNKKRCKFMCTSHLLKETKKVTSPEITS